MNAEQKRQEEGHAGKKDWRLWGPYISERAWGTVREDYSPDGEAWQFLDHDQARSRAYRWSEDGLAGICDNNQQLCFAIALWNGKDPILKERAFGLTGSQGNHGEDVKENFFYVDATPSHSYLQYLYKYPQNEFPYQWLLEENDRRSRTEPPFSLIDTGAFDESRYWDVEVTYAKSSTADIVVRITLSNRGPDKSTLHVLPSLWFRNTWSWGDKDEVKPLISARKNNKGTWAVKAAHQTLGDYYLYGSDSPELLFTENETNTELLYGSANSTPYVKDAFHRRVIHGETAAVNPEGEGSKFSAWYEIECDAGESKTIELVLSHQAENDPFGSYEKTLTTRKREADLFFADLLPGAGEEDALIFRQAVAGMIWCKQYFHYDVSRWLAGDVVPPPESRENGRNSIWRHLKAADIISMPDSWEYPWFAAWDLAYHSIVFSMFDIDFAKDQLELLLESRYLHPNGQIPAYEWSFEDVNPPVHAFAVLEVFRRERRIRGQGDYSFLRKTFNKLIMNFAWWLNRKDAQGQDVFEGGFMGLDNISVYDRSQALPPGYSLKQADATGWMAMFSLNMTAIAVELAQVEPEFEDMAIQCYQQFISIANAISGYTSKSISLWDEKDGFFKDLIITPEGEVQHIDVYSYVGLIPLFASEITKPELLANVPKFNAMLNSHAGGNYDNHSIMACPVHQNDRGEHLLSLVDKKMIPAIMLRLLDESQFLSKHGIRGVSRIHKEKRELGTLPGLGEALIEYDPGESSSPLFGGNSNWRGPIWMPINYSLLRALSKFHRYYGEDLKVKLPGSDGREGTLEEVVDIISTRIINIFRRDENGLIPAFPADSPFQHDPHWKDLRLFHEYFHGETGEGLGAAHQTGWSGLVANLIKRQSEAK